MSEVVFDESANVVTHKRRKRAGSSLEQALVRLRIAKTVNGARFVLILFLFASVISIFLISYSQTSPGNSYGNYDEFIKKHPEPSF